MKFFKKAINKMSQNLIFQIIVVVIFLIPLVGILGQYVSSGFMSNTEQFPIILWSGTKVYISLHLKVWILMSIMASTYLFGIVFLLRKKVFGIVAIIGYVGGIYIAAKFGNVINYFTGWKELQGLSAPNSINKSLFTMWTNPLWEEIVFRGIPLILLLILKKKVSTRIYKLAVIVYFLIPSVIFAAYHIPNHGPARITDTFITGLVFAYLALKYSFFAPLIIHYFYDARSVLFITGYKNLPKNQIVWLTQNSELLNTIFYNSIFYLKLIIPIIIIWNVIKLKKEKDNYDSLNF